MKRLLDLVGFAGLAVLLAGGGWFIHHANKARELPLLIDGARE